MKITNRILSVIAMLVLISFSVSAQSKIGHFNSAEVLQNMPAWKAAEKDMETYQTMLENKLKDQYEAFQREAEAFNADRQKGILAPIEEQKKLAEMEQKQLELQQSDQNFQVELMNKRNSLITPITDQVKKAVDSVAAEKGYDYIFDTSTGAFLYSNPSDDITELVKAKL